jgi:outer membrane protein
MNAVRMPLAALALAGAVALPLQVHAQDTGWSVRLGVTDLQPANESNSGGPLNLPSNAVHVSKKVLPELDIYYGFTPNIVGELVLTYPQKHEVTVEGTDAGSFKELPPTLLVLYHFLPGQQFDPYVGIGLNFTWITSVNLGPVDLKKTSFGAAFDIGGDFNLDKRWFLNADIKYITPLQTDASVSGVGTITTVKVNPILYSLGVGYHF